MNTKTPTTLEILNNVCSMDSGSAERTTILDTNMPCIPANLNSFFRGVCKAHGFNLEMGSEYRSNTMGIFRDSKLATSSEVLLFARYVLVNDEVEMFNTHEAGSSSIHFNYVRPSPLRDIHIELSMDGRMIVHTKTA